jgi:heme/copper-type cytochrome/quinol oxidase subunit 3
MMTSGVAATEEGHEYDSLWPFLSGISVAVVLTGLVAHWSIFIVGIMLLAFSALGLIRHTWGLGILEGYFVGLKEGDHILARISVRKMGMWVFLASEILFFTGLIGTGLALRVRADWWAEPGEVLNVPLTALNTFLLICSSMTMVEALRAAEDGRLRHMRLLLTATLIIGITFVGIQAFEYSQLWFHEGLTPFSSTYGSAFYAQTGFHGGHVSGGVLAMAVVTHKAWKGGYTKEDHEGIELMGLYWHFVDVVWIFLFTIVYLI